MTVCGAGCATTQVRRGPAPDFNLTALDGGQVRLSELRGKPVLLSFFAVGCPPCRAAAPHISRLVDRHSSDGLVVLAVNAWDEPRDQIERFVTENRLRQKILLDGGEVLQRYGAPDLPAVFWINRDGIIVGGKVGYGGKATLDRNTRALLNSG